MSGLDKIHSKVRVCQSGLKNKKQDPTTCCLQDYTLHSKMKVNIKGQKNYVMQIVNTERGSGYTNLKQNRLYKKEHNWR